MKVRLHLMVTQFYCSSWEKRVASLHSSTSTRLQCLRNAECVCKNTAFVHAEYLQILYRLRCALQFDTSSLILHQASPQPKTLDSAGNRQIAFEGTRTPLWLLDKLRQWWGESTTVAYRWFNHSSGRVEAHLWCTLCTRAFHHICCL